MFGTSGKTAWRLLAAVPFVLLLGIVGIKVTAGDPSSPFNKIPGAQTIQELGDDAPSTNVTVKLPRTKKPSPTTSASDSASATASTSPSASASSSTSGKPSSAPKPTKKPASGSTTPGDDGGPDPDPTTQAPEPTPPPLTEAQKCAARGGTWNAFLGWCQGVGLG